MAQSGYTPILIYASGTATNVPLAANMTSSASGAELALNYADGKLYYKNGSGVVTLLASSTTVTNSFSAGTTGLTPNTATTGAVTLAGTLITSNGGTGLASYTAGDLSYYASGTALTKLAIGTAGQILTSSGTAPQWSTLSGVAVTTLSFGTTGLTPSTATSGAITVAGTLATTNGGTGLTSFTSGGVVYASSSSALATGSALTFDGSQLGVGTASSTSNGLKLNSGNAGANYVFYRAGATGLLTIYGNQTGFNGLTVTGVDGDLATLTSTGLGIGTSSPAAKLESVQTTSGAGGWYMAGQFSAATASMVRIASTAGNKYIRIGNDSDGGFHLFVNGSAGAVGTEAAILNSSGNLGLGVAPSAWDNRVAFQNGSACFASSSANRSVAEISANSYLSTGGIFRYLYSSANATLYQQATGTHVWYTAASGTAGNAISFTQAMTLNSSAQLLVGSTTAAGSLGSGTIQVGSGHGGITNTGSVAPSVVISGSLEFNLDGVSGSQRHGRIYGTGDTTGGAYAGGLLLQYYAYDGSTTYQWYTGMVIDSGGIATIGAPAKAGGLIVYGRNTIATFTSDGSSTDGQVTIQAHNAAGYNARLYMECPGVNGGGFGYVRSNSRLYAWSQTQDSGPYVVANGTSWTTNSDARLKTNVQNIGYGLNAVLALSPKEYEYKIDEGKKCLGFIAQDVVAIIPELVDVPEDSNEMMGIEYQAFIPVLVKAIQELKAEFDAYKASHP
jgi:hypothetical protein